MDKTLQKPDRDEKYVGASPAVVVLGNSEKYGWYARFVGVGIGLLSSEGLARVFPSMEHKAAKMMSVFSKGDQGKNVILLAGALTGFFGGHWIGMVCGAFKAAPHRHEGREQFERIKQERNEALAKVDALETSIADAAHALAEERPTRFADAHMSREAQGGHAAAHAGEKHNAAELTR